MVLVRLGGFLAVLLYTLVTRYRFPKCSPYQTGYELKTGTGMNAG